MDNQPSEVIFTTEEGEEITFQVLETTRLGGVDYLLVSTTDNEEEALILKDVSNNTDTDSVYYIVDDDMELAMASEIFNELLDDIDLI
ncbi:MAG: DUF1292 domain-containing protein [Clostridiales bacterium]|nr:DUF1292 domain-containing protein [Clostridiales bacterium]